MSTAMSREIYEDELKQLWIAVLTPSSMGQDQFGRASRKIRHFASEDRPKRPFFQKLLEQGLIILFLAFGTYG
jgi:hypothetical protein